MRRHGHERPRPAPGGARHGAGRAAPALLGLLLALGAGPVAAQELGDLAAKAKLSDAERAKRDADKVYQWIRFNADAAAKPRHAAPAKPAAAVAPPAAPPRPRPSVAEAAPQPPQPAPPAAIPATLLPQAAAPASEAVALTPALAASAVAPAPELLASVAPRPAPAAVQPPEPQAPTTEGLLLLERVEPEYPRQVLRDGGSGSVLLRLQVAANGSVSGTEVLRSSNRRLVPAVLEAVSRWRFAPMARAQSAEVEIGFRSE